MKVIMMDKYEMKVVDVKEVDVEMKLLLEMSDSDIKWLVDGSEEVSVDYYDNVGKVVRIDSELVVVDFEEMMYLIKK